VLQQRPNTFAQTNLSPSFFACDKAADHTFRVARRSGTMAKVSERRYQPDQLPRSPFIGRAVQ
jgi:hypothetical protein